MNKNYILLQDKVLVVDDKFNILIRDNSVSIKEELICENIIEYLYDYLNNTKDDLERNKYFLRRYLPLVGASIFSIPSLCYLSGFLTNNITSMDTFIVILLILLGEGIVAISNHNIKIDNERLSVLENIIIEEIENITKDKEIKNNSIDTLKVDSEWVEEINKKLDLELDKRLVKRRKL